MPRDRPSMTTTVDPDLHQWLEDATKPGGRFGGKSHAVERGLWVLQRFEEMELTAEQALEILEDFQRGKLNRIDEERNNSVYER